jgi:hypothetical protein
MSRPGAGNEHIMIEQGEFIDLEVCSGGLIFPKENSGLCASKMSCLGRMYLMGLVYKTF